MIEDFRDEAKVSCGTIAWNPSQRYWYADLTEYTANWSYAYAKANNFDIDNSLVAIMDTILAVERIPYRIRLCADNDQLRIDNAETSLLEYIEQELEIGRAHV